MHNILLQYDGLDTIGDENNDYSDAEGMELDSGSENNDTDDPRDDLDEEVEIQVGYAEKRSRLWVHHKYALGSGSIRWMATSKECRPATRTAPNCAPEP